MGKEKQYSTQSKRKEVAGRSEEGLKWFVFNWDSVVHV
jgi:hypothetical protein